MKSELSALLSKFGKLIEPITSRLNKFYSFLKKHNVITPLLIAVAWQLVFLVFGIMIQGINNPDGPVSLAHMANWDGNWFRSIIGGAYSNPDSASAAFYPLFPLSVWLLDSITPAFIGLNISALIINTLALAVALWALIGISEEFFHKKNSFWLIMIFLSFPTAFFMNAFYSEALFCAFGFLAYYFALKRKWLPMGLMLGVLSASRITALLFIGLCFLEFWRAHEWSIKKIFNPKLLYFLLSAIGFVAFGLYLQTVRGDFFGMLNVYGSEEGMANWAYHIFNPNFVGTLWQEGLDVLRNIFVRPGISSYGIVNNIMPMIGLALVFVASVYSILKVVSKDGKRAGIPLGVFGLASIVFFSLNSNVVSVHRYLLPILVLYISLIFFLFGNKTGDDRARKIACVIIALGFMLQMYLLFLFINRIFAG